MLVGGEIDYRMPLRWIVYLGRGWFGSMLVWLEVGGCAGGGDQQFSGVALVRGLRLQSVVFCAALD